MDVRLGVGVGVLVALAVGVRVAGDGVNVGVGVDGISALIDDEFSMWQPKPGRSK